MKEPTVEVAIFTSTISAFGVFGGGLFGLFFKIWKNQREDTELLVTKFDTLRDKFDDHRKETREMFDDHRKETREMFDDHRKETNDQYTRLSDKFDAHRQETREEYSKLSDKFDDHREETNKRLDRIEHKLGIDPPAEAA